MKKNYVLMTLLCLLASTVSLFAQCVDVVRTITTKWDAPNTSNTWNWTTNYYSAYVKLKAKPYQIASPFYNPNATFQNQNILHLQSPSLKDNLPIDGWELLVKDFGNASNGDASAVTNPFFALYNRYRSTIRTFFLVVDPLGGTSNGATVSLNFYGASGRNETSLLAHAQPIMNGLNAFNKGNLMRTPNRYSNEIDYWLYADFPVSYDPCTCLFSSKISFTIELIQTTDADLNIKLKGTSYLKQIIKKQPSGGVDASGESSPVLDLVNGVVASGTKAYKSYEGFKTAADGLSGFLTATNPGDATKISSELSNLTNFAKAVPYLGAALGIFDFFLGGGKSTASTGPSAFEANLTHEISGNATGKLTLSVPRGDRIIWTPGSSTTGSTTAIPTYNNVLGLFSLLEIPQVEYIEYAYSGQSQPSFCVPNPNYNPNCQETPEDPYACVGNTPIVCSNAGVYDDKIRHYKLSSQLKFATNPHSKMNLIDLKAALVVYDTNRTQGLGNFPANFVNPNPFTTVDTQLNKMGYEFETDKRVRTAFVPLGCLTNTGILVAMQHSIGIPYRDSQVYIKIKATFRRQDAGANTQDVLYVGTYKTTIVHSASDPGNLKFNKVPYDGTTGYGYPKTYYYSASTVPFPLPITGIAGVQTPTYPSQCSTVVPAQTSQQINAFCTNTSKYNPVNNNARIGQDQGNTNQIKADDQLLPNTPNPFTDRTSIEYIIESEGPVKIYISDMFGRIIATIVDEPNHGTGRFSKDFSAGNLHRGIYYYTMQTADHLVTKRLLIEK